MLVYNYYKIGGGRSVKVSICGATGYTGEELLRILAGHPDAEIVHITSENQTGADIGDIYPHFGRIWRQSLTSMENIDSIAEDSDVVFIALPHGHAIDAVKTIVAHGAKAIDLGADYRFTDTTVYEKWYKVVHTHKNSNAVYGLTELYRDKIKQADIGRKPWLLYNGKHLGVGSVDQKEASQYR